jgi:hypothetical protein
MTRDVVLGLLWVKIIHATWHSFGKQKKRVYVEQQGYVPIYEYILKCANRRSVKRNVPILFELLH